MSKPNPITLHELLTLAFPVETRVWTDRASRERMVTWITTSVSSDIPRATSPGDFLILLPPYAADLPAQIECSTSSDLAGVAVIGEPSPALIDAAERAGVPLFALPASVDIRQIERTAFTLVLDRETAIEKRAMQIYQQLAVLSAENAGLDAMATLIGQTTGKTVLIQDKRLSLIAAWLPPEDAPSREMMETWVGAPENLPEELRDRKRAAQSQGIFEQSLAPENFSRLIAPIVAKGMARGFLSLIAATNAWNTFDRRVAEQSAAACALEMAKAKAVSEAEKRVRGGFVDALLAGSLSPLEAVRWAKRDKYNPDGRHAVIVADWAKKEHPTYRRLETLIHGLGHSNILTHAHEDEIVIFGRLEPRQGIDSARHIADSIRRQTQAEFPNAPLAIGIGRPVDALTGLRDSYREARQALSMARRLADPNPLYFGELKVYRLLFLLEHHPELASFCHEIIGTLIEYDRTQGTALIETLTAYFAHKGNLSQTSEALFIHRNTLIYRLERVREISGLDLDNPETRLSIELALRAHRLLMAREE